MTRQKERCLVCRQPMRVTASGVGTTTVGEESGLAHGRCASAINYDKGIRRWRSE